MYIIFKMENERENEMAVRIIVHRGTKEVGGSCVEIKTEEECILIDFGMPLVDENKEPFDARKLKGKTISQLKKEKILPDIRGLYKDDTPSVKAILISHPHPDHYGLLSYVHPDIPIYMSQGCAALMNVSHFFGQTDCHIENRNIVKAWQPFEIGGFTTTPYLVDHSGFDSLAFLIEADGRKIFYSGDFRAHGRKAKVFHSLVKEPPKNVDALILEGTMLERESGDEISYRTEEDVELAFNLLFKDKSGLTFVACSSQNIDRLVSLYKACLKTGCTLVIDPYTAYVLDCLKPLSKNLPQYDWGKSIRVYFAHNSYTDKLCSNGTLFKFKSAKITNEEIQASKSKIVMKYNDRLRGKFTKPEYGPGTRLIYSLWEGYLKKSPRLPKFFEKHQIPILKVHSGGHAYVEDLQKFVRAMKPKNIIPIHTFHADQYEALFGSVSPIIRSCDGEPVEV